MIFLIILMIPFQMKNACIHIGSRNRHLSNEECLFSMIALLEVSYCECQYTQKTEFLTRLV